MPSFLSLGCLAGFSVVGSMSIGRSFATPLPTSGWPFVGLRCGCHIPDFLVGPSLVSQCASRIVADLLELVSVPT